MAILMADGFDFYANTTDFTYVGSPWVSAPNSLSGTVTPYGVGQSIDTVNTLSQSQPFANTTTIYLAFDLQTTTTFTGAASAGFFVNLVDNSVSGTCQVQLQWALDGNFYIRSGVTNTLVGFGSGTIINTGGWPHGMAPNSWVNWQVKVVIDNAVGSVELRKNNSPADVYSITNINTRSASTNNYVNVMGLGSGNSVNWYVDNLFVNSSVGAAPTSWPGQVRAVQLMPNADTATKAMTASTGTTNYSMVNELKENGDTNYVFGSVAGNVDLYAITPLAAVPAAIVAVATKNFMRKSDTGARTATTEINSGGLIQDQATINLATTYQWQTVYFPTDPNTGATWTFAGVNALQIGPKVVA
jgi:hypothetical protein